MAQYRNSVYIFLSVLIIAYYMFYPFFCLYYKVFYLQDIPVLIVKKKLISPYFVCEMCLLVLNVQILF